ncbi:MAG: hypothetical protein M3Y70_08300 [Pseudomonadota bacterium]|nr:hypothetical protein [Pseudomonadota bacterium]
MRASNDFTPPIPDAQAVASFEALLASLEPDVARVVLRDCLAEIALWQHHLRVQQRHYAADARPREMFHIG